MADATKAMQQLDSLEIAGSKLSVKIAAIAPNDPMTMMTANLDLDDEGMMSNSCLSAVGAVWLWLHRSVSGARSAVKDWMLLVF